MIQVHVLTTIFLFGMIWLLLLNIYRTFAKCTLAVMTASILAGKPENEKIGETVRINLTRELHGVTIAVFYIVGYFLWFG